MMACSAVCRAERSSVSHAGRKWRRASLLQVRVPQSALWTRSTPPHAVGLHARRIVHPLQLSCERREQPCVEVHDCRCACWSARLLVAGGLYHVRQVGHELQLQGDDLVCVSREGGVLVCESLHACEELGERKLDLLTVVLV